MIQLNKTSLFDEVNKLPVFSFQFSIDDSSNLKSLMDPVKLENLKDSYYSTGYPVALMSVEGAKLFKEIESNICNNNIDSDDKVYFTKSSLFPRASFNRYSDKARLVQTTKAATKYAVPTNIESKLNITHTYLFKFKSSYAPDGVLVKVESNNTYNILHQANNTSLSAKERELKRECGQSRWNIDVGPLWFDSISKALNKELGCAPTLAWEGEKERMAIVKGYTLKEKETIPFLISGEIEIEDFVNDTEVNRYIDTFKGEFDDSMYEYLHSTLSAHTSDPEVPMQLLCNMRIDGGNPRLDALFINLPKDAKNNIVNHRVMNTVDVKNFMNNHGLMHLLDYYSTENIQARLNALRGAVVKYNNPVDRRKLFDLTKDGLEELINNQYGLTTVNIKLNYEELKESDEL